MDGPSTPCPHLLVLLLSAHQSLRCVDRQALIQTSAMSALIGKLSRKSTIGNPIDRGKTLLMLRGPALLQGPQTMVLLSTSGSSSPSRCQREGLECPTRRGALVLHGLLTQYSLNTSIDVLLRGTAWMLAFKQRLDYLKSQFMHI